MLNEYRSDYVTIKNSKGLEVTLSSLGAGVRSLHLHGKPLLLELKNEQDYLSSDQFFGKTLGRVAGRMPSEFKLGQREFHLPGDRQGICLHGGIKEAGYPGNLSLNVLYLLKLDALEFSILYDAYSDRDTYLSLSNHMYWNVFGSADVDDYQLQVNASRIGSFKKGTQLIIGDEPVPECLDFRRMTKLKIRLDQIQKELGAKMTLDHTYRFDEVDIKKPNVILETEKLRIETYTDFDAVNFYVDSSLNPWEFSNRDDLKAAPRRGIAIEPENFPSLANIFLPAGKNYRHKMTYKLMEK